MFLIPNVQQTPMPTSDVLQPFYAPPPTSQDERHNRSDPSAMGFKVLGMSSKVTMALCGCPPIIGVKRILCFVGPLKLLSCSVSGYTRSVHTITVFLMSYPDFTDFTALPKISKFALVSLQFREFGPGKEM